MRRNIACLWKENSFVRKRARKKSLRLRMYKGGIPHLTVLHEQTIRTLETARTQQFHSVQIGQFLLFTYAIYAQGIQFCINSISYKSEFFKRIF